MSETIINAHVVHIHNYATSSPNGYEAFIKDELSRGLAHQEMTEEGYNGVPHMVEEVPAPTEAEIVEIYSQEADRLTQEEKEASARKMYLFDLVSAVDRLRSLEGYLANPEGRHPANRKEKEEEFADKEKYAADILANACGTCALRKSCRIAPNLIELTPERVKGLSEEQLEEVERLNRRTKKKSLEKWIDIHPYKDDDPNRGLPKRRGSLQVKQLENRTPFLEALRKDDLAHCDPWKDPQRSNNKKYRQQAA